MKDFKNEFRLVPSTGGSKGEALPGHVKAKLQSSMGQDFSDVKIHKNSMQAHSIGAKAYTQGNDIHFAPGQYKPGNAEGEKLLGHELAHVVQQRQGQVKGAKGMGQVTP